MDVVARDSYEEALKALNAIAWSDASSAAQRRAAREAREGLVRDFIEQEIEEVEARNAQYRTFLDRMQALIGTLGGRGPVDAIRTLTGIVKLGSEAARQAEKARARPRGVRGAGGAQALRVLCVHGVGDHHSDLSWQADWTSAIRGSIQAFAPSRGVTTEFILYDDLFERHGIGVSDVAGATGALLGSAIWHGIGDLFRAPAAARRARGGLRWTAGMVAQWADNRRLRRQLRARVAAHLARFAPDLVCAHSLGSLICYDTFLHAPETMRRRRFVSFGSQIGHAAVRGTLGGTIADFPEMERWVHLYNPHDSVFTAPLRLHADNFEQVDTPFDIEGMVDHDALEYLRHPGARLELWSEVAAAGARGLRGAPRVRRAARAVARRPRRRALLVGINHYPAPEDRLEGCVNDVYLMSEVLQEYGFPARGVRLLLDRRASTRALVERLDWLVDGARAGDRLVFFFSGHGAQIPGYNAFDEVDHIDECLVPHDFDWSLERALVDDRFKEFYSQLPYGLSFTAILDCCHSGGMARGSMRVRGLTPPADVRHRMLEWRDGCWDARACDAAPGQRRWEAEYAGTGGYSYRLGRAIGLRAGGAPERLPVRARAPYLPILLEACQEAELAEEYRHGSTAYGAFTHALAQELRRARRKRPRATFATVLRGVRAKLKALGYSQKPALLIPRSLARRPIPWYRA